MIIVYNNKEYPLYITQANEHDEEEIFRSIAPDTNGDYLLLEFHSSNGVKIIDFIAASEIKIESEPEPKTCRWTLDGYLDSDNMLPTYDTGCGLESIFSDYRVELGAYCNKCGNRIEIVESDDD